MDDRLAEQLAHKDHTDPEAARERIERHAARNTAHILQLLKIQ